MLFWLIIITVLGLFCQAQDTVRHPSVVPPCKTNDTSLIQSGTKLRVAVISHYSIVATFFANPEAAAREAASLLNMELEWDRHVISSSAKMKEDIQNALDSGVDGMIVSIPNQEIYETVKEATKTGIPIIVFNTGMEYAQKLGLIRVLQSDKKSAETMANELKRRNYTRPLAVQITSSRDLDEKTFSTRANGISQYLGRPIDILSVTTDFDKALIEVENTFSSGSYDSIISLGGLAGVDLITAASLNIHKRSPDRRLTVAFYDAGSKRNMSDIFNTFPEAFGISQLPYYQASLPVFMMYIQLTTGYPPFINKTVNTGPNLVTKETYSQYVYGDGNSIIPGQDLAANIGVVIINTGGDTYQSGIMAGINDLAAKLNWTVTLAKEDWLEIPVLLSSMSRHLSMEEFMDLYYNQVILLFSIIQ
ncbi:hypothetical protein BDC45DRAFT_336886 [Circinella umbellata]|nr:hypothetical protein BDC45DRAFT_336886 [Circinella umbellata]